MSSPWILLVHILPLLSTPSTDVPSSDSTCFSYLSPQPAKFLQTSAFSNIYYKSSSILIITPLLKTFNLSTTWKKKMEFKHIRDVKLVRPKIIDTLMILTFQYSQESNYCSLFLTTVASELLFQHLRKS